MNLQNDITYAFRTFRRAPAFTIAAVLTLALGIGANTAIFSVVNGVLLRPLPFLEADRIYAVWNHNTREGIERDITSYPNFLDWRDQGEVWDALAAVSGASVGLTGSGDPEQVRAAGVTADFLRVFGVSPALGRDFSTEEMLSGGDPVVLVSTGLWQRRFGGDPGIVGQSIHINGQPHTVIGVMPPFFAYPLDTDLWRPLALGVNLPGPRGTLWLRVIGRLRPDVQPELARQRMSDVAAQLAETYPGPNTGAGILLEPLHQTIVGEVRAPLLILLSGVLVVLLIGCANVANLLLARGVVRQKELSIRIALGASRRRVAGQLLTESVVLSLAGGVLGALLAVQGVAALVALAPSELPRLTEVRVDASVLLFTTTISVLAGLLFGLAPLLQAGRHDLVQALRDGGRGMVGGKTVGRMRPVLVAGEVALALVLLVTAGLLIRSFLALSMVNTGFVVDDALTFRVTAPAVPYDSPELVRQFHTALQERLEALPGTASAGAVSTLFLTSLPNMAPIIMEGDPPRTDDAARESVVIDSATPDFFNAFGVLLRRGRTFTMADDAEGLRVAIVNEAFVRRYIPGNDAIGQRFAFGDAADSGTEWLEIVGVVADARRSGLAAAVRPEAFVPHLQRTTNALTYVIRSNSEPNVLMREVRAAVREIDPLIPVASIATIGQILAESLAARRFVMMLLGAFATLGLLLAAVGIYGVVSYLVAQRRREVGIRIALGALPGDVLRLIVGQSMGYVMPGIVLGGITAVLLTRLLRSQLFGVAPGDPLTLAAVALTLLAVGALASYLPARRAARTDPQVALREE